jgi:hypothetical protein
VQSIIRSGFMAMPAVWATMISSFIRDRDMKTNRF